MPTTTIDHLAVLQARLERGYSLAPGRERRPILESAFDLLNAAAACGGPICLNPVQTAALYHWIDAIHAMTEAKRAGAIADIENIAPPRPAAPSNIVPFRACS